MDKNKMIRQIIPSSKVKYIILLSIFLNFSCQPNLPTDQASLEKLAQNSFNQYCSENPYSVGCPEYCKKYPQDCGDNNNQVTIIDEIPPSDQITEDEELPEVTDTATPKSNEPEDEELEYDPYCTSPYGKGENLRKGIVTIAGGNVYYVPGAFGLSNFSHNISPSLISLKNAKNFYSNQGRLKVRFRIMPQPKPPQSDEVWCYKRKTNTCTKKFNYSKLKFNVSVVGLNSDGTLKKYYYGSPMYEQTTQVESYVDQCTKTVDFSGSHERHPHGAVVVIHDVLSNQDCDSEPCSSFSHVRSGSCWQVEIQVSADGTKNIY